MSPIKDRSVSTENERCALVTEYQRYEESVLREKSYALNMADRELIRLAVFDPHGVNDARELIATIMAAIDEAVEIKTIERLSRWEESERQKERETGYLHSLMPCPPSEHADGNPSTRPAHRSAMPCKSHPASRA